MSELWNRARAAAAQALAIRNHGPMLNERYLHHFVSRLLHQGLDLLPLGGDPVSILLHPEWPTCKKKPNLPYGRYRFRAGKFLPADDGSAGFIDFALGSYESPEVAVEMSLKSGWPHEEIVYDFVKLLDGRNPFKYGLSLNVLLRPNGLSRGGRKDWLHRRMLDAYEEALNRLQDKLCQPDRKYLFLVCEIATDARRHWCWDEARQDFLDATDLPPTLLAQAAMGAPV